MKKIFKSKKGVSLLEALIVCVVSVFIILTLLALLSSARSTWAISDVKSDLYINARRAMYEMFNELIEASSGDTESFVFVDPLNGEYAQGLWFASARGNEAVAGEDGSSANNYFHLDASNVAAWRSLVVYCAYETADGIKQLRRYVDYGPNLTFYNGVNIFPLTVQSVTAASLNLLTADAATVISIDRAQGRVLANYISNEDANNNNALDANENDGIDNDPVDNEDGALNYGANFTKNVGSVDIVLFLSKEAVKLKEQGRFLSTTLRNRVKFRQP
ncbi:MAG: hypothetical protein HY810_03860 [Candidatus Omnitrophica bacterium]|nr:hypothetical protein [Candidatus Omnitrophota bacterium]